MVWAQICGFEGSQTFMPFARLEKGNEIYVTYPTEYSN